MKLGLAMRGFDRDLGGKKITVIGLGISGCEAALFARRRGADVFVSEMKENKKSAAYFEKLKAAGVEWEIGKHSISRIEKSDLVIISPGIKPQTEIYRFLEKEWKGLWVSEIEFAFRFAPCEVIAVTGTSGKTTTTSMIAGMFRQFGIDAVACGNIGNPFIAEIENLKADSKAVVEVSSFQLERTSEFRPHVAVLLNLSQNHFDWHGTMENYVRAKLKIFRNQTGEDLAVLNAEDACSKEMERSIKARIVYFNQGETENPNWDAVLKIAGIYGLDREKVMGFLRDFPGIAHRMEKVGADEGICFINDSKATTPSALEWALRRMNKPVILICGGSSKKNDFSGLGELAGRKVKQCVLIGETSPDFERDWKNKVPMSRAESLRDAVKKARAFANQGDTVLLSPGCASFDMFANYEDRGDQFKKIVAGLGQCPHPIH